VNFWELLQGGDLNQDLPLQDGDTIVIPTATALAPEEITRLSASSFSPNEITINVVGEVVNPGSIQVPPNTPLNQAILAAGGLNNRASTGSVQLLRLNPEGTVYQQAIDFDLSAGLSPQDNPALRPNDTIVVGRKGIVQFGDAIETALGSFLSPFAGISSFVRLFGF
jgi:polysaccharide export outer membrane protein